MRRPTARRQQPGMALFPFLAVLLCTMGSLIVLLVLVVQQARAGSAAVAEKSAAVPQLDPEEQRRLLEQEEDLQWRAEMLQQQRDAYAEDLLNKREELSHFEDHIRRLQDRAEKLVAEAEEMQNAGKGQLADRESAMQQLAEMEKEIAERKAELEKSRKEVLRRRPAYAIIPYDGPNGTSRRPMYIECTEEGIVLQPERVVLSANDFQGPMGPGNPLDAALRATRDYLHRGGLKGEPYPLVIVRPSGAIAFGACRTAMKHWESEFGYELVDQDAEIKFQPADPQLAALQQRAVQDARKRQQALVAAMPKRFADAESKLTSFRAADNQFASDDDQEVGPGYGGGNNRGVPGTGTGGRGSGNGPRGASGTGGSGTQGTGGGYDRPAGNSLAANGTTGNRGMGPGGRSPGNGGPGQNPGSGQQNGSQPHSNSTNSGSATGDASTAGRYASNGGSSSGGSATGSQQGGSGG